MILRILIAAAALSALTGIFGFVQFVRYRGKEQEGKENFYKDLHYIALFVLFALGIAIMFVLAEGE